MNGRLRLLRRARRGKRECRASDRLDTTRMCRPRRGDWRAASAGNPVDVRRLLQRDPDTLIAGQGRARAAECAAAEAGQGGVERTQAELRSDGATATIERRRSAMRTSGAVLLAAVLALSPLDGVAGDKQIAAVEELAGSWQGWITRGEGRERATMYVSADGSYRSLTKDGASTEGKFYLQDGKLLYRSSRTTG